MSIKQIVTCDGCGLAEMGAPSNWLSVNVPSRFLSGVPSEKGNAAADLCPQCYERAAMVFNGYRTAVASAAAKTSTPAPVLHPKAPEQAPKSTGYGARFAQVLAILTSKGPLTRQMLLSEIEKTGASPRVLQHCSSVLQRMVKRGDARAYTATGQVWYNAVERKRAAKSKRKQATKASDKQPRIMSTVGAAVLDLLRTGPATTTDLVQALELKDRRAVNGALQFMRKHNQVDAEWPHNGGEQVWRLSKSA